MPAIPKRVGNVGGLYIIGEEEEKKDRQAKSNLGGCSNCRDTSKTVTLFFVGGWLYMLSLSEAYRAVYNSLLL